MKRCKDCTIQYKGICVVGGAVWNKPNMARGCKRYSPNLRTRFIQWLKGWLK